MFPFNSAKPTRNVPHSDVNITQCPGQRIHSVRTTNKHHRFQSLKILQLLIQWFLQSVQSLFDHPFEYSNASSLTINEDVQCNSLKQCEVLPIFLLQTLELEVS